MSSPSLMPYRGESLRSPHIGVVFADSIGDFAVATVLMKAIRESTQGAIVDYFGGPRTEELESSSDLIDDRFSLFNSSTATDHAICEYIARRVAAAGLYDLVINLDSDVLAARVVRLARPRFFVGKCQGIPQTASPTDSITGLYSENWAAPDLCARYEELETQHISEIWSRLSYLTPTSLVPTLPSRAPGLAVPDVLIGTGATRSAKIWPAKPWVEVVEGCRLRGLTVGLLGASRPMQHSHYHCADIDDAILATGDVVDLRGKITLPQVVGALEEAKMCVSIDNGIMHLAVGARVPTIAIFGGSAWRVWAQPVEHLTVLTPQAEFGCQLCIDNRFRNRDCLIEHKKCMDGVRAKDVFWAFENLAVR